MMATLYFCALLALFLLSSVSIHGSMNCGPTAKQFVNTSGSVFRQNPFQLPFGPLQRRSSDWTWHVATASHDINGGSGSIEQRLWLSTSSDIDLRATDLGFVGCGAVFHGLTQAQVRLGQHDDSRCSSIFDDGCRDALFQQTLIVSRNSSLQTSVGPRSAENPPSALMLCQNLAFLFTTSFEYGLPSQCSKYFTKDAWIQTFVFASPSASDLCPGNPAFGNISTPLATWGAATYSPGNMAAYENLTTSITPLMAIMFPNRTVDAAASSDALLSSVQRELICLRSSDISMDSGQPRSTPSPGTRAIVTLGCLLFVALLATRL